MTWQAINHIAKNSGAPEIDYDRFAARWESDPILKDIVDRFDGAGLVIKTQQPQSTEHSGKEKAGAGEVSKMAKRALNHAR